MRKLGSITVVLVGLGTMSSAALGAFTNGNVIVTRVNSTSGAAAAAVFVEEYTLGGALVQSIALPSVTGTRCNMGAGGNEGLMAFSTDNQYLTFMCHDAALLANTTTGAHPRVMARVDMNGAVDLSTVITNQGTGWSPKSAVMDGNNIWITGGTNNRAVMHTTFGSNTGTVITAGNVNGVRVAKIYNNQLYVSVDPGTNNPQGVFTVGSGLPTSAGQSTALFAGTSVNADLDIWDFWFADSSTLYFSDSRALASGGGIQKWTFDGATWAKQYTLSAGLTNGMIGLFGVVDGSGTTLFGTTTDNKIVSVTDTGAASAFNTIVTGATGNLFRGIVMPVPEPGSLALLAVGGLILIRRR